MAINSSESFRLLVFRLGFINISNHWKYFCWEKVVFLSYIFLYLGNGFYSLSRKCDQYIKYTSPVDQCHFKEQEKGFFLLCKIISPLFLEQLLHCFMSYTLRLLEDLKFHILLFNRTIYFHTCGFSFLVAHIKF